MRSIQIPCIYKMNLEGSDGMIPVYWLGAVVLLLVIEAITMGLTTIWFAGGALAAFFVALAGGPLLLQVVVFLVISALMLIFTRPAAARFMNQKIERTNVDSLIGKHAVVTETVDDLKGTGRVLISGVDWKARSGDESLILHKDEVVKVSRVDGVKLIVNKITEE